MQENFALDLLKTAFVNPCYIESEEARRRQLGLDKDAVALQLQDNAGLAERGLRFARAYLAQCFEGAYPELPAKGTEALVNFLTSQELVSYVAQNLSIQDLALCRDFPAPPDVLQRTFLAVIGALLESSGPERTGIFVRVRSVNAGLYLDGERSREVGRSLTVPVTRQFSNEIWCGGGGQLGFWGLGILLGSFSLRRLIEYMKPYTSGL